MKRIPAVLSAVVAMAFVATVALAADTTAPATTAPAAKTTSTTTHHKSSSKSASHKTDINSASKEDLMKLPGIDDATADKIIAARPFKSRSELESKSIVTKEQYTKLSALVTVAPPAKSAAK